MLLRGYGPRLIGGLKVLVKAISKLEMGCHTIRHRWNLNLENQKTKINETKQNTLKSEAKVSPVTLKDSLEERNLDEENESSLQLSSTYPMK